MFNRKVKFDNIVYSYHEVTEIKHVKNHNTSIRVKSYVSNPYYINSNSINQIIYIDFDDTITFDIAETLMLDRPEFTEYIDVEEALLQELAPTLTDEQAASVINIYPIWSSIAAYTKDDRIRYSNGFYKCLQDHQAQEEWTPAATPSLWSAIIDASILPIGEYPLWQQPDSINPYSEGDIVTYGDSLWISLIDNNVWAPGIYGWNFYTEPEGETGETGSTGEIGIIEEIGETGFTGETGETSNESSISEWIQPNSTNPYMQGDRVIHVNKIWESTIDNNVWEPGIYGWTEITV